MVAPPVPEERAPVPDAAVLDLPDVDGVVAAVVGLPETAVHPGQGAVQDRRAAGRAPQRDAVEPVALLAPEAGAAVRGLFHLGTKDMDAEDALLADEVVRAVLAADADQDERG